MTREADYPSLQAREEESQQYQWLPANPVNYYLNYQNIRALFSIFVTIFTVMAAVIGFFIAFLFIRFQEIQNYHLRIAEKLGTTTPVAMNIAMNILPVWLIVVIVAASASIILLQKRGLGVTTEKIVGNVNIKQHNTPMQEDYWDAVEHVKEILN